MKFDEWFETHFGPWLAASRAAARFSEVDQFRESLRVAWDASEKASAAEIDRLRARVADATPDAWMLETLGGNTIYWTTADRATADQFAATYDREAIPLYRHPPTAAPDVVPVPREELAVLREIVRLLDEARQRYAKRPCGAGGQRMPDEIDDLLCHLYEMGAHPAQPTPSEGRG